MHEALHSPAFGVAALVMHHRLMHWFDMPAAEHAVPMGVQTCWVLAPICVNEHENPWGHARLLWQGVVQMDCDTPAG